MRKGTKLRVSMMVTTTRFRCESPRTLSKPYDVSGSHSTGSRLAVGTGMVIFVFTIWKTLTLRRLSASRHMRMRSYR